ncbi:MAG TPA: VanZ family protein [Microthrixaceae bacterium]|nr:VanZ family protein [Microthrixaceae bacterium]
MSFNIATQLLGGLPRALRSPDQIGSSALLAALLTLVAVFAMVARANSRGEPIGRALVNWLSIGWLIVTSVILLTPRNTLSTDGMCTAQTHRIAVFDYDIQRLLNILMFVPIGLLFLFLARTVWQRVALGLGLLAMPPLFEGLQATSLIGRTCEGVDVVDNWTGVVVGILLAVMIKTGVKLWRHLSRYRSETESQDPGLKRIDENDV